MAKKKKKHTEDPSEQLLFSPLEMIGEQEQASSGEPVQEDAKETTTCRPSATNRT